jgi:hypothetical protein
VMLRENGKRKYLGTTVTNQYYIHKEIKSRLNSRKLVKILFRSSRLLPAHVKTKMYKT